MKLKLVSLLAQVWDRTKFELDVQTDRKVWKWARKLAKLHQELNLPVSLL